MTEIEDIRKSDTGIENCIAPRPSLQKLLSSQGKLTPEETSALTRNAEERVALLEKTLKPTSEAEPTKSDALDYNNVSQLVERVKQGTPQELENYLAIRYVGEGGLFYVLQGYNKHLDESRPVALKISKQKEHFEALQRHKETLLRMKHPNIPDIIDASSEGKVPFVAEQFIAGETLADIIAKNKTEKKYLSEETVLSIANQLLSAVSHMHEQGVTHNDIKPHNVIMKDGKVYLTDFNIADIVEEDIDKAKNTLVTASATKFVAYTDVYASPKQRQGKVLDNRTDLYSLGLLLFEMLTNEVPIGSDIDPASLNPNLTRNYVSFFTKALKSRPEDRFQNAQEMMNALNSLEKNKYGGGTIFYGTLKAIYAVVFNAGRFVTKEIYQVSDKNMLVDFCLSPDKKSMAVLEWAPNHNSSSFQHFPIIVKKIEEATPAAVLFTATERDISKITWNTKGIYCKRRDYGSGVDKWAILDLVNVFLSDCGIAMYAELPLSPNKKYRLHDNTDKLLIVSNDRSSLETLQIAQCGLNYSLKKYVWTSTEYSKFGLNAECTDEQWFAELSPKKSAKQLPKRVWYNPFTW